MFLFILKESFKELGRAKFSFFFSLISISLGVILIQSSLLTVEISGFLQQELKSRFKINAYLSDEAAVEDSDLISREILGHKYVKTSEFISKDQAAEDFIAETGEDFREVLDYNPLPASFIVSLDHSFLDTADNNDINLVLSELEAIPGITDVSYKAELFNKLLQFLKNAQYYIYGVTILLVLIAVYIVYTTLRLIITNRREEIETIKLVGGSISTIKMPILLNGLTLGLLADIAAILFLFGVYHLTLEVFNISLSEVLFKSYFIYASLALGPVIGVFCSFLATRNISMKIQDTGN